MSLDSEFGKGTRITVRFPERGLDQKQEIPQSSDDPVRTARS